MRRLLTFFLLAAGQTVVTSAQRPNILWLTSEDNGPQLGCYGDSFADTPHLDALAARGVCFDKAWSNAPVCAPARTTIVTGVYAPRLGAEHMRSEARPPAWLRFSPQLLRGAGYYCTNHTKTDYNLSRPAGGPVWHDKSSNAHWRNRPDGAPFFAVFNFETTHESQTRKRPHTPVHDPAEVPLPPYWPDTPTVRQDWAQYYDKMTEMDAQAGAVLAQLEADGLADDTIVFYYGDHGAGFPRCKRSMYDSGLRVPMIVAAPPKWKQYVAGLAGTRSDRLVAFVDLAPTVLRIAGVDPPAWMDGRAFLGPEADPPKESLFGYRGRMDARYDFNRAVRDQRWLYVRNYLIDRPGGQRNAYMFQTPMTREWKRLFDAGGLDDARADFWRDHPAEELFDLQADPDSLNNLAGDPVHAETLGRMRELLADTMRSAGDTGFLPEAELVNRSADGAAADLLPNGEYDYERIARAADDASRLDAYGPGQFAAMLSDADAGVRYWGAIGLRFRGAEAVGPAVDGLTEMLDDPSNSCRIAAGEALAQHGHAEQRSAGLETLLAIAEGQAEDYHAAMMAWNTLDRLDGAAASVVDRMRSIRLKPLSKREEKRRGRGAGRIRSVKRTALRELAEAS